MDSPHWTSLEDNCFGLRSPVKGEPRHSRREIGSLRSVLGRLLGLPTDKCLARCWRCPKPNRPESIRSTNCYRSRSALHPDDHRPGRSRSRPHLRLWYHRLRRRAVGTTWITCDTSRVALALARTRLMGAKAHLAHQALDSLAIPRVPLQAGVRPVGGVGMTASMPAADVLNFRKVEITK